MKQNTSARKLRSIYGKAPLQRGQEYKWAEHRITCLLITLLSLIPIMSGGAPCSDSVTGVTAGLALIRNDH